MWTDVGHETQVSRGTERSSHVRILTILKYDVCWCWCINLQNQKKHIRTITTYSVGVSRDRKGICTWVRISLGRKRLKEREKRILRKQRRLISPNFRSKTNEHLNTHQKPNRESSSTAWRTNPCYQVSWSWLSGSSGNWRNPWHLLLSWTHLR